MKTSLNHVFRVVWPEALNTTWIAVSELTKAKGNRSSCGGNAGIAPSPLAGEGWGAGGFMKPLVFALACCFIPNAQANPIGAQVVNGAASISQIGNVLTVTNTPSAIINWQGFSINAGETTHFIQQSAGSSVLNRVVGPDPSQLLGTLTSNGRVFLINPAGIMVGQGAMINVPGFVASTLNLSNADFLAGKLNFAAMPNAGAIQNNGTITTPDGGTVYLVAPQVTNNGIINTPKGETILAAGDTVTLLDTSTPGVSVQITGSNNTATNLGQILADTGRIGMVGAVVRNSGTLNANSLVSQGGRVFLNATQTATVDAGSQIAATGATGGTVEVQGNQVALNGNANIDASGMNGGGTVLVGGDAHGANPNIQNAQNTHVDSGVTLKADSTLSGNGGKVVVWADGTTQFNGNISAKGGALSGNGGWVEVSGKQKLGYNGFTNALATHGLTGSLLLDPANFTIAATGGDMTGGLLTNVLVGASVTITTNGGAGTVCTLCAGVNGDIIVNDVVSWTNTTLTLNAAGNINVNVGGTMTATGVAGNLVLNHGFSPNNNVAGTGHGANIGATVNVAGNLIVSAYTPNGTLISGGGNLSIGNGIVVSAGTMSVNGGNVGSWVGGASGTLNISTSMVATGAPSGLDNVTLNLGAGSATTIGSGASSTTIFMRNGAKVNNSGTVTMSTGSSIIQEGLVATSINNTGVVNSTSAHFAGVTLTGTVPITGTWDTAAVINNSGIMDITGGPNKNAGGNFSQYATVSVNNNVGATMFVYDPTYVNPTVIPANFVFTNNGTMNIVAGFMSTSSTGVNNGTINISGNSSLSVLGGNMTSNGVINLGGQSASTAFVASGTGYGDIYTLGGSFTNVGTLNALPDGGLLDFVHAYSGTITNSGVVNVAANATIDWMSSSSSINSGTFNVAAGGTMNIVDPGIYLLLAPAGATYTFNGAISVAGGGFLKVFGVSYAAPGTYTLGTLTPTGNAVTVAAAPVITALVTTSSESEPTATTTAAAAVITPPPPLPPAVATTSSGATMAGPAGGTAGGTAGNFGAIDTSASSSSSPDTKTADSGKGNAKNGDDKKEDSKKKEESNGEGKSKDSNKDKSNAKPEKC